MIVRGPGVAPNSWCHVPVVGYDLFPTFCAWAKLPAASLPDDIEGGSLAPLLAHGGRGELRRPREGLVFHFPHYQTGNTPQSAIRVGDLKLLKFYEDESTKLFDLAADIGEPPGSCGGAARRCGQAQGDARSPSGRRPRAAADEKPPV